MGSACPVSCPQVVSVRCVLRGIGSTLRAGVWSAFSGCATREFPARFERTTARVYTRSTSPPHAMGQGLYAEGMRMGTVPLSGTVPMLGKWGRSPTTGQSPFFISGSSGRAWRGQERGILSAMRGQGLPAVRLTDFPTPTVAYCDIGRLSMMPMERSKQTRPAPRDAMTRS